MRSITSSRLPLYLSVGALCAGIAIQMIAPMVQTDPAHRPLPRLASLLPRGSERLIALEDSVRAEIVALWDAPISLSPFKQSIVLRRGDTLSNVLERAGLPPTIINNVVQAVHSIYNPKNLHAGQEVELAYDPIRTDDDMAPAHLAFEAAPGHRVTVERQADGGYEAKEIIATTRHDVTHADGVITSSLFEAAESQRLPADVLAAFVKMFSYDVDFQRDLQKGDRFEVMYDREVTAEGQSIRNGAIRYASLVLSGNPIRLYAFRTPDGSVDYYNEKGEGVRKALLRTPVNGATITSSFGMRKHPILGYSIMHRGVDFGVPSGTPIMAAGDGVIEKRERSATYGNYIRIRHNSGYATAYAHMSRFGANMANGQRVRQGEIIGYVGMTGRATGPHLHFEMFRDKQQVNPINVKFPAAMKLEGALLTQFRNARDKMVQEYASVSAPQIAESPAATETTDGN